METKNNGDEKTMGNEKTMETRKPWKRQNNGNEKTMETRKQWKLETTKQCKRENNGNKKTMETRKHARMKHAKIKTCGNLHSYSFRHAAIHACFHLRMFHSHMFSSPQVFISASFQLRMLSRLRCVPTATVFARSCWAGLTSEIEYTLR